MPPGEPVDSLRLLFRAVRSKADDFASCIHPGWIDSVWNRLGIPRPSGGAGVRPIDQSRESALVMAAYGIESPGLLSFRVAEHRIALLNRPQILAVLAVQSLHRRKTSVRRTVGKASRAKLIELLGASAYLQLMGDSQGEEQGDGRDDGAVNIDPLNLEALAEEGYQILSRRGAWQCRHSLAMIRLCLAPAKAVERMHAQVPLRAERSPPELSVYFPELIWLFGSDMDRALSA